MGPPSRSAPGVQAEPARGGCPGRLAGVERQLLPELLERALAAHGPQVTADLVEPLTLVERLVLHELVTKLLAHSARGPVQGPARS